MYSVAPKNRRQLTGCVLWMALPLLAAACGDVPSEQAEPLSQELKSTNGISFNGISFNGISFNGISFNGLSPGGLADPGTHRVVEYLISCALPEGERVSFDIEGHTYAFDGKLGLAPEWKDQACGPSCQRWVSACMLARVNGHEVVRTISMRGEHKGLVVEPQEMATFPRREATYFGNIFLPQPQAYACLSPGETTISRICGDSVDGCALPVVGQCDEVCKGLGRQKSFRDCGTVPFGEQSGEEERFPEAITVFLPK